MERVFQKRLVFLWGPEIFWILFFLLRAIVWSTLLITDFFNFIGFQTCLF